MDRPGQYVIAFKGLSLGHHSFEFEVDHSFFEHFEFYEFLACDMKVGLDMEKKTDMLIFNFRMSGHVTVPCDRCNDPFNLPLEGTERLIVKFGEAFQEESEDVLVIPDTEHQLDVSSYLFEYITLLTPIKKVHPDDADGHSTCNPEVLKKLENLSPAPAPDPRWDILKNLKS